MLQAEFNQLKSEHDTLLELHEKSDMQAETLDSTTVQVKFKVEGFKSGHSTQYVMVIFPNVYS